MEIQDLLNQTSKLPNVPEVVRELVKDLNNPNADYGDIAAKVTKDQTLALKILRLVNSAQFGLSRKVSSIDEATIMLGMAQLKTLVIASGFAGCANNVEGLDVKAFWSESFRIATLARWFAERSDAVDQDVAFTVGIIHNIGRLLLHLAQPNRAKAIETLVSESKVERREAELERLGFTSQDAGKALLDMWKFPEELGLAVQNYKLPMQAEGPAELAAVIHLACYVNACIRDGLDLDSAKESFPEDVMNLAKIKPSCIEELSEAMVIESGLDGLTS